MILTERKLYMQKWHQISACLCPVLLQGQSNQTHVPLKRFLSISHIMISSSCLATTEQTGLNYQFMACITPSCHFNFTITYNSHPQKLNYARYICRHHVLWQPSSSRLKFSSLHGFTFLFLNFYNVFLCFYFSWLS